jgi:hypothetical protein
MLATKPTSPRATKSLMQFFSLCLSDRQLLLLCSSRSHYIAVIATTPQILIRFPTLPPAGIHQFNSTGCSGTRCLPLMVGHR